MNLPYAFGKPPVTGRLRARPEDFVVDELLGFVPEGQGAHLWLAIRKRGENTLWVARQLAQIAGCAIEEVGYAGLKDRHALTCQWFSLPMPRRRVDWSELTLRVHAEIVAITRHSRKLRIGGHRANRFLLTVRELQGDLQALEARLRRIAHEGVPNFFGEQRFGLDGGNLAEVRKWFATHQHPHRRLRGLLISVARSHLFNAVLAHRLEEGHWLTPLPGEPLILDGRQSFFIPAEIDATILQRVDKGQVHTSGPLWGKGGTQASSICAAFEQSVVALEANLGQGLEREGVAPARRPLRVIPRQMHWRLDTAARILCLGFILPAGSYATAVMREIIKMDGG